MVRKNPLADGLTHGMLVALVLQRTFQTPQQREGGPHSGTLKKRTGRGGLVWLFGLGGRRKAPAFFLKSVEIDLAHPDPGRTKQTTRHSTSRRAAVGGQKRPETVGLSTDNCSRQGPTQKNTVLGTCASSTVASSGWPKGSVRGDYARVPGPGVAL